MFAGTGTVGHGDGIGNSSFFNAPFGIAIDQQTGNLYVSDCCNHVIRRITPQGTVSTFAGSHSAGFRDGKGKSAKFNNPRGIFFNDKNQCLLVCDYGNCRIRRVTLQGEVTTLCEVKGPGHITCSKKGIILVSCKSNVIAQVTPKGWGKYEADVLAGSGKHGTVDGTLLESKFSHPTGLVVLDNDNTCFVAELCAIRKVSLL